MISKRSIYSIVALIAVIVLLSGCGTTNELDVSDEQQIETEQISDEESNEETIQPEEVEEGGLKREQILAMLEAPKAPTTTEELLTYPFKGQFADYHYNLEYYPEETERIREKLDKYPSIVEYGKDDELLDSYWNTLISLFIADYPHPTEVLDQWGEASFGDPEINDSRYQFKDNINIEIILDASGSMAGRIGGKTKMELAKEAIKSFVESLPKEANVALRVYGHKGSNQKEDKEESCNSNELVYKLQPYNKAELEAALNKFQPTGYTPIACSLEEARKDLAKYTGDKNTNIIYLVSDGIETCDGDPVKAAKELAESNITPIVHVLGFDIDNQGQQQLKAVAKAADGIYADVTNQEELEKEFDRAEEIAEKWKDWKWEAEFEMKDLDYIRGQLISDYDHEFRSIYFHETSLLNESRYYLIPSEKITYSQHAYLLDRYYDYTNLLRDSKDEITENLEKLQEEDYQEMKKQIEEKYSQHVNE